MLCCLRVQSHSCGETVESEEKQIKPPKESCSLERLISLTDYPPVFAALTHFDPEADGRSGRESLK